ncbi:MAG: hypothetical protein IT288_13480 [Bdellovibrionales bacterium]|nr:hypothetical protein [Bdellovibrionales bacterium]
MNNTLRVISIFILLQVALAQGEELWQKELPTAFSKFFKFIPVLDDKDEPIPGRVAIAKLNDDQNLPPNIGVLKAKRAFGFQEDQPTQLEWAVSIDQCGKNRQMNCAAMMQKPQAVNKAFLHPYRSFVLSQKQPELSRILFCNMGYVKGVTSVVQMSREKIQLHDCVEISKSKCDSWSSYLSHNPHNYQKILDGNCLPIEDCRTEITSNRQAMGLIFSPTQDAAFKQKLMSVTQEATAIRVEPEIIVKPFGTEPTKANMDELVGMAKRCVEYSALLRSPTHANGTPAAPVGKGTPASP